MAYTEVRNVKGKKYYYRVISVRKKNKVGKNRIYLGANLSNDKLLKKEIEADKILNSEKIEKNIKKIKSKVVKILKKYDVKRAGIFGSYATGKNKKGSDVDILITNPESMKARGFRFIKIEYELESALKRKVDLITYNSINPLLKKRILNEEIKII